MSSCTSLMPTACPAKTWLRLILIAPRQMRPHLRDHDGFVVERILDIRQAGVGTWGGVVNVGRTFHIERFVRAFGVEDVEKGIKASLLLKEVGGRGLGGFFLQREVHAFMTAVLVGLAGLDAFDANAEAEPPDGQPAQVKEGVGGRERDAIIASDVSREPALFE